MHIGLFTPSWPPGSSANGIVTYTAELKAGLEAIGHRVTVICPSVQSQPSMFERLGNRLRRGNATGDPAVDLAGGVVAYVRRMHRADPFDVVEMEETFGWSRLVQQAIDVPVVTRLHGPHFLGKDRYEDAEATLRTRRREDAEGEAIRAALGLTSPSARLLVATLDHYHCDRRDGRAIFNPLRAAPEADLWTFGGSDPATILCVGRFDWRKGADIVLRAYARVVHVRPDARLVLAGPDKGVQLEPGRLIHFAEYCREYLPADVAAGIYLAGTQSADALRDLRRQARVTVVGSRFETFSYAATEAMAMGCPLVGTDICGVGEVILGGESGWLAPPEDPAALADALLDALARPEECERRARQGWQRCRDLLDPSLIAGQMAAYYRDTINGGRSAAR